VIIKVRGYLTYKAVIGQREYKLSDDESITLLEFLRLLGSEISGEHGQAIFNSERGTVGKWVAVMLNGRHYNHLHDRLDTVLQDQDEVAVFPPGAGG
jgi:molybdopterin converting factor small subunit